MKEMFKGQINSPYDVLAKTISASDTTIEITDPSVFPKGPNIAVIGIETDAETIKYESINNNFLVGCIRGFQGKAKVWEKGMPIARNFTEYDLEAVQENIKLLSEEKMSYEEFSKKINDFSSIQIIENPTNDEVEKLDTGIYLLKNFSFFESTATEYILFCKKNEIQVFLDYNALCFYFRNYVSILRCYNRYSTRKLVNHADFESFKKSIEEINSMKNNEIESIFNEVMN